MIVLTLEQITKNYGIKPLMDHVDLTIETGDRIGVIGVNGVRRYRRSRQRQTNHHFGDAGRIFAPESRLYARYHCLAGGAPPCCPKSKEIGGI